MSVALDHQPYQPFLYIPENTGLKPYAPYKKARRLLGHVGEVLRTYAQHLPLTVRQIYYRLVSTHSDYPKTNAFYRSLVETLARARRGGLIPWNAIRDDGVTTELVGAGYAGLEDFKRALEVAAANFSLDKAIHQPTQIFVLCEASGMVPQLVHACAGYPVTVRSSGGMDSVTAKYDLARLCLGQDSLVLHVGDYDPTGLSVFHQLAFDVAAMIEDIRRAEGQPFKTYACLRVGVLTEHVAQYGLVTGIVKDGDRAKTWFPGIAGDPTVTCEAEALPPDVLAGLVRGAVADAVNIGSLMRIMDAERDLRDQAVRAVAQLKFTS